MVHLGFIIKTKDLDETKAIQYLREGIATGHPGVIDGRFFFHLGDALYRIGNHKEVRNYCDIFIFAEAVLEK